MANINDKTTNEMTAFAGQMQSSLAEMDRRWSEKLSHQFASSSSGGVAMVENWIFGSNMCKVDEE